MSYENDLNEKLDRFLLTNIDICIEKRSDLSKPFTARQFYGEELWHQLSNCFGPARVGTRFSSLVAKKMVPLIPCGKNSANANLYQLEQRQKLPD